MLFYLNKRVIVDSIANIFMLADNTPHVEFLLDGDKRWAFIPYHENNDSTLSAAIAVNEHGVCYGTHFNYKTLSLDPRIPLPSNMLKGFQTGGDSDYCNNMHVAKAAFYYHNCTFDEFQALLNKSGRGYKMFDLLTVSKRLKAMQPEQFNWVI